MNIYTITAAINLLTNCIEFKEPFNVDLRLSQIRKIELFSFPSKINVIFVIESDSGEDARALAYLHLERLTNKLSFGEGIPIKEFSITGITCEEKRGNNLHVTGTIIASIKSDAVIKYILGKESIEKAKNILETTYSNDSEELLAMYREAISKEGSLSQYVLLYRILEKVLGAKGEVDTWIKKEDPDVMTTYDKRIKQDRTIYTDLRSNIHPKQVSFPHKEISEYLPKLRELAKKAITANLK